LAQFSGVSEPTLLRFENGLNAPESRTENKLFAAFDRYGIEFTENQGVRFKPSNVDVYNGRERFDDFYDFLYRHLSQVGGDVCVRVYNERLFYVIKSKKEPDPHMVRMKKLFDQGKITFRILTTVSDFQSYGYAVFRWLPNQPPSPTAFYAFGDCLALFSFVDANAPQVIVIHSALLAEGYRQEFNMAWRMGKAPPTPSTIDKLIEQGALS